MPIYEYECHGCKNRFELMRPFSKSQESADCPRCQKKAKRVMSCCYSKSTNEQGISQPVGGSSCTSCSSHNCGGCGH